MRCEERWKNPLKQGCAVGPGFQRGHEGTQPLESQGTMGQEWGLAIQELCTPNA